MIPWRLPWIIFCLFLCHFLFIHYLRYISVVHVPSKSFQKFLILVVALLNFKTLLFLVFCVCCGSKFRSKYNCQSCVIWIRKSRNCVNLQYWLTVVIIFVRKWTRLYWGWIAVDLGERREGDRFLPGKIISFAKHNPIQKLCNFTNYYPWPVIKSWIFTWKGHLK